MWYSYQEPCQGWIRKGDGGISFVNRHLKRYSMLVPSALWVKNLCVPFSDANLEAVRLRRRTRVVTTWGPTSSSPSFWDPSVTTSFRPNASTTPKTFSSRMPYQYHPPTHPGLVHYRYISKLCPYCLHEINNRFYLSWSIPFCSRLNSTTRSGVLSTSIRILMLTSRPLTSFTCKTGMATTMSPYSLLYSTLKSGCRGYYLLRFFIFDIIYVFLPVESFFEIN